MLDQCVLEINLCLTSSFRQGKKSHKYPYILLYRTVNQFLIKSVSKQHYLFPRNINTRILFKESLKTDFKNDLALSIKHTHIILIREYTNMMIRDSEANALLLSNIQERRVLAAY